MFNTVSRSFLVFLIAAFALVGCQSSGNDTPDDESIEHSDEEQADETVEEDRDPLEAPADVAAPPEDATVTDSGLATRVLSEGHGDVHPEETDVVTVDYTGWTTDGEMFDSSVERGEPTSFPLNQVIAGWTEGVQLMVEGETRRLWIPEDLAYQGQAGPPAGMLVFDVTLIEIQ